jgi:diguanylate cyclase (GGDEF)-like protein
MNFTRGGLYNFRGLICAAVAFIGLAVFAIGYTILNLRSDTIDDAYHDTSNIATVMAEQVSQTVRGIDLVLSEVEDRVMTLDVRTSADFRRIMATEYGYMLVKTRVERFPQAEIVSVADSEGMLIASSRAWPLEPVSLADRDYFLHFKNSTEKRTYISLPIKNRITGTPTVFFSRPLRREDGELLGLLIVGVPISKFRHVYETVSQLGEQGFMLSRTDGTILVRYPEVPNNPRQTVPLDSPWFAALERGGGNFRSQNGITSDIRLISVRMVPGYPLVVNVGVSETDALAVWRKRSISIAIGTLFAIVCSSFLLWALANRIRLLRNSEVSLAIKSRELEAAKAQTDAAVNNISQGISMFDAQQKLVVCNARYLEIYGLSPGAIKPGSTFKEILEHRIACGNYISDPARLVSDSAEQVLSGKIFNHIATLTDGRIIAVTANPTVDGGWVSTHEDITERHRAESLIAHMASHDALTDLYNRAVFEQRLKEALIRLNRHGEKFALLMFDLDKFKSVNDTLGHLMGDAVLKNVAHHTKSCVRELDTAARLGGDEFIVLLAHTDEPEQAARTLANRLLDATSETFNVGEHLLKTSLSIGIALAPKDGTGAEQLLKRVDLALYRAKAEGRNRFRFFDADIDVPPASEPLPRLAG